MNGSPFPSLRSASAFGARDGGVWTEAPVIKITPKQVRVSYPPDPDASPLILNRAELEERGQSGCYYTEALKHACGAVTGCWPPKFYTDAEKEAQERFWQTVESVPLLPVGDRRLEFDPAPQLLGRQALSGARIYKSVWESIKTGAVQATRHGLPGLPLRETARAAARPRMP
jgi:hypothetical protein